MIVAVLFFGIAFGAAGAGLVLIAGHSIWLAIITYSVSGSIASILLAAAVFLVTARRDAEEAPLPKVTPFRSYKRKARLYVVQ